MMKYEVIGTGEVFEDDRDAINSIVSRDDFEDEFDEYLRDEYGDVDVCGVYYDACDLLKDHDWYEYDRQFDDWFCDKYEEWLDELERHGEVEICDEIIAKKTTEYKIINTDCVFDDAIDAVGWAIETRERELNKRFDNWLNDNFGCFEMYGQSFTAEDIFKNCDPSEYERKRKANLDGVLDTEVNNLEKTGRAEICDLVIVDADDINEGGDE